MKVIGLARRKGEYQGNAYDNMMIYCTRPAVPESNEQGEISDCVKIKFENYSSLISIGSDIRVIYDRFGRVVDIEII